MNRRSFIQALGLSAAAVALSPMLDFAPIEPARSASLTTVFIPQRTLIARVFVTPEILAESGDVAFAHASRAMTSIMLTDMATREAAFW